MVQSKCDNENYPQAQAEGYIANGSWYIKKESSQQVS